MNVTEADTVLEVLSGYWPTPALTEEEAKAWGTELCGRMRITPEEAAKVISAPGHVQGRHFVCAPARSSPGPGASSPPCIRPTDCGTRTSVRDRRESRRDTGEDAAACRVAIAEGTKAIGTTPSRALARPAVSWTVATEAVQIRYHTGHSSPQPRLLTTTALLRRVCRTSTLWILLLMRSGWGCAVTSGQSNRSWPGEVRQHSCGSSASYPHRRGAVPDTPTRPTPSDTASGLQVWEGGSPHKGKPPS